MFTVWVTFHVIVCVALVLVVLMQSSKGDGLAGTAFSGGVSGAVFGGRGAASFLSKSTTVLAVIFMVNCGVLAFMSSEKRQAAGLSDTPESTVTRKMAEEQESALQRQAAARETALQDSLGRTAPETSLDQPAPADTGGQ